MKRDAYTDEADPMVGDLGTNQFKRDTTIVIPTVPVRKPYLDRAVQSARDQTHECDIVVRVDPEFKEGVFTGTAGRNRNAAMEVVSTTWTAFLDDDDVLHPQHVERLLETAEEHGADLVYPWFDGPQSVGVLLVNGETPEGMPWSDSLKEVILSGTNFIPITVLVRTELVKQVGGFPVPEDDDWPEWGNEDWGLWVRLLKAGATFAHLDERTWTWKIHGAHLSRANF